MGIDMVYSFHHFYYWVRGGLEYAQAYRAKVLRRIGVDARFVFTTMFPDTAIWQVMEEMGFLDSEVLWLNGFFTDCRVSPVTYTLEQLRASFGEKNFTFSRKGSVVTYSFPDRQSYYVVHMKDSTSNCVYKVEMIVNGCLLRTDYYTYCRIYSEYYAPLDGQAHLYLRRYFQQDGTTAYEEIIDRDEVVYKFPDRILYSKNELLGYMISRLQLTKEDVVLIDAAMGTIDIAAIIQNAAPARIGLVMHSNHFVESETNEDHVRWHVYYEYAMSHPELLAFYIASTEVQNRYLTEQFWRYKQVTSNVVTIPPSGLDMLQYPQERRRKHAVITASRLAFEKHVDWIIAAVVEARRAVPDLTLDIYGEGGEEQKLRRQIEQLQCGEYVRLCGHRKLDEIYRDYEVYVSASFMESFGITFMEAIGAGLALVGFDVLYGSRNFIDEGQNGYIVPWKNTMDEKERIHMLAACMIRLFTEDDLDAFHEHSYQKARGYLTEEIERKWRDLLCREI